MYDYDSLAAFRIQRQSILLDCEAEMKKYHKTFYDVNIPVDVIPANSDLSGYKVLILPQMIIAKTKFQENVKEFVEKGGTLVLTYRDFVKDVDNNLVLGKSIPIDFDTFAGVCMVESESLQEGQEFPVTGEGEFSCTQGMGGIFRDMLEVEDAEILLRYNDVFYKEFAAVTRKKQKKGYVYYIGCGLEEAVLKQIMRKIAAEQKIDFEHSTDGVEVMYRGIENEKICMVINHNPYEVQNAGETLAPFECKIRQI